MSPVTDSRNSRPVWSGPRSYRFGTIDTSSPGSMMRAAAMPSSSDRFAGCLPGACDRTTVSLRLISVFQVDLLLEQPLGLLPGGFQVRAVGGGVHRLGHVGGHLEQPPGPVPVGVNPG